MSSDFYLTLPSNSEPSTNTTAKFSVYLPYKIDLPGKWEVALAEIQYPFSWNNLSGKLSSGDKTDNWIEVTFPSGYATTIYVPPGFYETIEEVLEAVDYGKQETSLQLKRKSFQQPPEEIPVPQLGKIPASLWKKEMAAKNPKWAAEYAKTRVLKEHSKAVADGFIVSYNKTLKRVKVKKNPELVESVQFSPRLQYMLGLHKTEIKEEQLLVDYILDLRGGFYALYVYCSLVEPQIVGNHTAPLLRLVNIEGTHGAIVEKIFHSPHYVPVVTKEITRIDIEIKDDNAQFVPFDFGKTIVKLHIRKRRPLL